MLVENIELPYIMTIEEFEEMEERNHHKPIKRKKRISKKIKNTFPKFKRKDKKHLFFKVLKDIPFQRGFYLVNKEEEFTERLRKVSKIINIDEMNPYLLELNYFSDLEYIPYSSTSKDFFYGKPVKSGYVDNLNLYSDNESKYKIGTKTQNSDSFNVFNRRKMKAELAEISSEIFYALDELSYIESSYSFDYVRDNAVFNHTRKEKKRGYYCKNLSSQEINDSGVYIQDEYNDEHYFDSHYSGYEEFSSIEPKKSYFEMNKPFFVRDLWNDLAKCK